MARLHAFVYAVIDHDDELDTEPTAETFDIEEDDPEALGTRLVAWLRELADGLESAIEADR